MSVSSIWLYRLLLLEVLGLIGVYWEIETEFSVSSIRFSSTPLRIGNGGGFLRSMRMQGSPGSPAPAARRLRSDMGAPEAPDFGSQEIRTARLYIQRSDGAVPSLVIVGADKGGTSEAFAMLAREFQVLDPGHKGKKELGCLHLGFSLAIPYVLPILAPEIMRHVEFEVRKTDALPRYEAWNGTQGVHDCYQEYFGHTVARIGVKHGK